MGGCAVPSKGLAPGIECREPVLNGGNCLAEGLDVIRQTELPAAGEPGGVAGLREDGRESCFVARQRDAIGPYSVDTGIETGEQTGAGRAALEARCIRVGVLPAAFLQLATRWQARRLHCLFTILAAERIEHATQDVRAVQKRHGMCLQPAGQGLDYAIMFGNKSSERTCA